MTGRQFIKHTILNLCSFYNININLAAVLFALLRYFDFGWLWLLMCVICLLALYFMNGNYCRALLFFNLFLLLALDMFMLKLNGFFVGFYECNQQLDRTFYEVNLFG